MQALKEEVERLQSQTKTFEEEKAKTAQELEAKQKMVSFHSQGLY